MVKLLLTVLAAAAATTLVAAQDTGRIVFHDPSMPPLVSKEKPSCAVNDMGVCEEDPEYDIRVQEHINRLLRQDTSINALVRDPSLKDILNDAPIEVSPEISTRTQPTESESPVCYSQETLIYPKRAKTANDDWVFVLNQDNVQQALRVEKCIEDGSPCSISSVLPSDARATCRQKYVYRRMLTVGTNKIEPEQVLMPSCCVCYTTYKDLIPHTRFNNNNTGGQSPPQPVASPMSAPAANPNIARFTSNGSPLRFHFARSLRRRSRHPAGGRK